MAATLELNPKCDVLTLRFTEPITASVMTTDQVEETISNLGIARANMVPAVPETWRGGRVSAQRSPGYSIDLDMFGDVIFHLRDPALGWQHYVMSREHAHKLGADLLAVADMPAPTIAKA